MLIQDTFLDAHTKYMFQHSSLSYFNEEHTDTVDYFRINRVFMSFLYISWTLNKQIVRDEEKTHFWRE